MTDSRLPGAPTRPSAWSGRARCALGLALSAFMTGCFIAGYDPLDFEAGTDGAIDPDAQQVQPVDAAHGERSLPDMDAAGLDGGDDASSEDAGDESPTGDLDAGADATNGRMDASADAAREGGMEASDAKVDAGSDAGDGGMDASDATADARPMDTGVLGDGASDASDASPSDASGDAAQACDLDGGACPLPTRDNCIAGQPCTLVCNAGEYCKFDCVNHPSCNVICESASRCETLGSSTTTPVQCEGTAACLCMGGACTFAACGPPAMQNQKFLCLGDTRCNWGCPL